MSELAVNFWNKCNNNCIFCFCKEHDLLVENLDPMSISSPIEVGRALLKYKNKCQGLIISGNEPTLNPDLLVVIMLARKMGYSVDLRTNGRKLKNRNFCRKLLRAGVDRISITLLSYNSETHDFLSNAGGAFKETVEGIKNLLSLWEPDRIGIFIVVTKYNFKQLKETVTFLYDLGIRDVQFNCVYHTDRRITPALSKIEKKLQVAISEGIRLGIKMRMYGFPLCFLGQYYKLASELTSSNEVVLGGRVTDYKKVRTILGKKKTKYCLGCRLGDICEGAWKAYYNIYGDEEFKNKKIL